MVSEIESRVEVVRAYPFEISVNNPQVMKVTYTGHDPGKLRTIKNTEDDIRKTAGGLTNYKRFAPGLDLVYCITFPFCIQVETMRKK